jgi:hypothetical protein
VSTVIIIIRKSIILVVIFSNRLSDESLLPQMHIPTSGKICIAAIHLKCMVPVQGSIKQDAI